jgi:hypothetical protein
LTNAPDDKQVDHINHNTLDNQKSTNLRVCTHSENLQNARKHKISNTSPYKGVIIMGKKAYAFIVVDKKKIRLGKFETPELAAVAYNKAAIKYFGEFACINEEVK